MEFARYPCRILVFINTIYIYTSVTMEYAIQYYYLSRMEIISRLYYMLVCHKCLSFRTNERHKILRTLQMKLRYIYVQMSPFNRTIK